MPGTLSGGEIKSTRVLAHANPGATILASGHLPIIFFMHGFGETRQSYTILCEELASQGYVVLSLDLPYVSNFTKFSDGTTLVPTAYDTWKSTRDRDYRYHFYDEAMGVAIEQIRFMIDHLDSLNAEYFSGKLETVHIGIMGHSFGGNVAHTLGFQDQRIQAVVDLDSKITERMIFGRIGVPPNTYDHPVLFIRGALQYQDDVGDSLIKITHAEIKSLNVQHSAFRDIAYLSRRIDALKPGGTAGKLWDWFFKAGPQFDVIDVDLGGQKVEHWFNSVRVEIDHWLSRQFPCHP